MGWEGWESVHTFDEPHGESIVRLVIDGELAQQRHLVHVQVLVSDDAAPVRRANRVVPGDHGRALEIM